MSQREPELLASFFQGKQGYFVEVGANEPIIRSQTYHLEMNGWSGVLIEPQPDLAILLQSQRRAQVFPCACSSPEKEGSLQTLYVDGPLSSLDRDKMAPGASPTESIKVPVRTLDSILDEACTPVNFELLSLDVEGHELEVMSGFDAERWQPKLIMIEDHVSNLQKHRFMKSIGYKLIKRFDSNGWYVPKTSAFLSSFDDTIEIIRKYYLSLPIRKARNASRLVRRKFSEKMS